MCLPVTLPIILNHGGNSFMHTYVHLPCPCIRLTPDLPPACIHACVETVSMRGMDYYAKHWRVSRQAFSLFLQLIELSFTR